MLVFPEEKASIQYSEDKGIYWLQVLDVAKEDVHN